MLKRHGHHLIFVVSLASLTALVAWWSVFIHHSIRENRELQYAQLESLTKLVALELGTQALPPSGTEVNRKGMVFIIRPCQRAGGRFSQRLLPQWPRLCIHPDLSILKRIEDETQRKYLMLFGESGVLTLIVLISSVFLYRYIRMERRSLDEVKEFWEKSAHEIKTPITGIKLFLQNLREGLYRDKDLTSFIDLALQKVESQEKLAENVLSGYSLKSKDAALKLERVDLVPFLQEYIAGAATKLSRAIVETEFPDSGSILIQADVYALKVILDNIFDNAVKYGPEDLVLHVGISSEKKKVWIRVRDNGSGFDMRRASWIFEAYKHLGSGLPGNARGTGMGLYISRRLARRMRGDLLAFSEGAGKGAEFRIGLPGN